MRPPRTAWIAGPALVIFLSSNLANLGNLGFNMLFGRWMTPADFALLAACLTVLLGAMGILESLRMAASQHVAGAGPQDGPRHDAAVRRLAQRALIPGAAFGVAVAAAWLMTGGGGAQPWIWLLIALPAALPLSLLRGASLGRMRAGRVLLSAQVEMLVRLIGGALAWQAGWGLNGVVAAIALSVVAAWAVLACARPFAGPPMSGRLAPGTIRALTLGALPFAGLQTAQLGALDGDVLVARLVLSQADTGLIAALSLFQRVQFYGCFGLASVLLPAIALAVAQNAPLGPAIRPVAILAGGVAGMAVLASLLFPGALLSALVGPQYGAAAPGLWMASLTAALFTFSYLAATMLIAQGDLRGLWAVAAGAVVQGVLLIAAPDLTLTGFLSIKLGVQAATAVVVTLMLAWPHALPRLVQSNRKVPS